MSARIYINRHKRFKGYLWQIFAFRVAHNKSLRSVSLDHLKLIHRVYKIFFIALTLFLTFHLDLHAKTNDLETYVESLSVHRIKFSNITLEPITPQFPRLKIKKKLIFPIEHDITQQLHELLLDLKSYYEVTELIPGYTIQAYTGSNRQLAFQTRDKLTEHYPHAAVEIQYKQPNFTVRMGRFLDRLEAYGFYVGIKKMFPQAIIRPTQLPNKADIFDPLPTAQVVDTTQNVENDVILLPKNDEEQDRYQIVEDIEKKNIEKADIGKVEK